MFEFLKKKIGDVISRFSETAEENPKEEPKAQPKQEMAVEEEKHLEPPQETIVAAEKVQEKPKETQVESTEPQARPTASELIEEIRAELALEQEKPSTDNVIEDATPKPIMVEEKTEERIERKAAKPAPTVVEEPKKKGIFGRITNALTGAVTTTRISAQKFEEMFSDMEMAMLENNVAVEAIDKIKADLKESLVEKPLQRGKVEETIRKTLRGSIEGLFISGYDLMEKIKAAAATNKPVKIMFVGINGSGKTTTIAKMAKMLQDAKLKPVIAASDTFRAAAIHQLQEHVDKLGVKLIKHDYGADPAAVAFDAVKYAEAHGIDVVLIDTAGRLHSNVNLIEEMKKISRVAKPDFKIFVGESITGNDCVEQARSFNEAIGIDGIILSKADVDEKGGAAISVSYVTQKPIFYLGTGQGYDDLTRFRPELVVEQLGLTG